VPASLSSDDVEKAQIDSQAARSPEPRKVTESSLAANVLLQASFELLGLAISLFLGGLAAYLGLVMAQHVKLGTGKLPGNVGVFAAFMVSTVFCLSVFGHMLGQKDRELARCSKPATVEREQTRPRGSVDHQRIS